MRPHRVRTAKPLRPVKRIFQKAAWITLAALFWLAAAAAAAPPPETPGDGFMETVQALAALGDRSTGTPGNRAAAGYIRKRFAALGFETVGGHRFSLPVRRYGDSLLHLPAPTPPVPLHPLECNAVTPQAVPPGSLAGPLVYVGRGDPAQCDGKQIAGAIVLMDLASGKNWQYVASLGASALIYVDRKDTGRIFFEDKMELTPIHFPRFWMPFSRAQDLFGDIAAAPRGRLVEQASLSSAVQWENAVSENVYCLIPGSDPQLREELLLVEAFYDATALVPGLAPGADEGCSIAALIELARYLKSRPPGRSVLLVATGGHAQTLAGMREMIWTLRARSRDLRRSQRELKTTVKNRRALLEVLEKAVGGIPADPLFKAAIAEEIKSEVDRISRRLMQLRLAQQGVADAVRIQQLADRRLLLRRLGWRSDFSGLEPAAAAELQRMIPQAAAVHRAVISDAEAQLKLLRSSRNFQRLVKDYSLAATVSLHLSSHGDGFGAFNDGWLYEFRPRIKRAAIYSRLDQVLREAAAQHARQTDVVSLLADTLRPSGRHSWQDYLVDRPALGGEVSALAGYLGTTLATVHDARATWGTPHDLPRAVDGDFARRQSREVNALLYHLTRMPALYEEGLPRIGLSNVEGRANFLRHGELFADQPAPGSVILAYQGNQRYHGMVDTMGRFTLKGVADKKHVYDKIILEAYRFDPRDGRVLWAIDKEQTGKSVYRLKMQRRNMEADLVMFACRQVTLFNLLEPRNFRYLTKIKLIDGRLEAEPVRYWWSRIDTRESTLLSVCLDPGTRLKMTLSDTVLGRKMILTNASEDAPGGTGYPVDQWPRVYHTGYKIARDMWQLLRPRLENLERHGIFSQRIRSLEEEGRKALQTAHQALQEQQYRRFGSASRTSWALASRVYNHIEATQRDVLLGVLFTSPCSSPLPSAWSG